MKGVTVWMDPCLPSGSTKTFSKYNWTLAPTCKCLQISLLRGYVAKQELGIGIVRLLFSRLRTLFAEQRRVFHTAFARYIPVDPTCTVKPWDAAQRPGRVQTSQSCHSLPLRSPPSSIIAAAPEILRIHLSSTSDQTPIPNGRLRVLRLPRCRIVLRHRLPGFRGEWDSICRVCSQPRKLAGKKKNLKKLF